MDDPITWEWRPNVPSKRQKPTTQRRGVKFKKTEILQDLPQDVQFLILKGFINNITKKML